MSFRTDIAVGNVGTFALIFMATFLLLWIISAIGAKESDILSEFVCSGVVALVIGVLFIRSTYVDKGKNNIVLRKGGDRYYDLGPGSSHLGFHKYTSDVLDYDPSRRTRHFPALTVQMKDGSFLLVDVSYSWKPDHENLPAFFQENVEDLIGMMVKGLVQERARGLYPREFLHVAHIALQGEMDRQGRRVGARVYGPHLNNVRTADGRDMTRYVRDTEDLVEGLKSEIRTEAELEELEKELRELYPGKEQRIRLAINDRLLQVRRREKSAYRRD